MTIRGNLIKTTGEISTPLLSIKIIYIKDFYLNSLLREYEYIRLLISIIPKAIIEQYNLYELICNRFIHIKMREGMYGHIEASQLVHNQLVNHPKLYGYEPARQTPKL